MYYLQFNTPEEFFSYQDTIISNWKMAQTDVIQNQYLYRGIGRTTAETTCIRKLINNGNNVLYVISKSSKEKPKRNSELIGWNCFESNDLVVVDYEYYRYNRPQFEHFVDRHYVVFDHYIFESYRYTEL